MRIHCHQNQPNDTLHVCPGRLVFLASSIGDHETQETLLLCSSLEYVTFLIVTPNMTNAHIVNRRPLFTHLGEMPEDPSLYLATDFLVFEMPPPLTPGAWWEKPNSPDPLRAATLTAKLIPGKVSM